MNFLLIKINNATLLLYTVTVQEHAFIMFFVLELCTEVVQHFIQNR